MKFHTRLVSLLLAGSLLLPLAACSDRTAQEPDASPSEPAVSDTASPSPSDASGSAGVLPEDFTPDLTVEDVCLATLGVPVDSELFTVNGVPVTAGCYLYWTLYCISNLQTYMSYYGVTVDLTTDVTFADYIKEDALAAAVRCSVIESKAKELGFEMTDEQVSELESSLALSAEYMGGEEAFQDYLRRAGLSYDSFYQINAASYYYAQLTAGLFPDPPTAEEMDAYIEENDILQAKHILLMTVDSSTRAPLDEETIAQKKATAEDVLARLQASTDLEADFDALMHEYSEDPGLVYNPDGYTFTAGEMVTEFEQATRALEYGQISGIVESATTGYHIILRLDPDTEAARADCLAAKANEQVTAWADEADVVPSDEFDALNISLFYARYNAYQEAFNASAAADSQEN